MEIAMPDQKKVLVVEDEPDIRNLIAFALQYAGYQVLVSVDGEDALRQADEEQPDLILLDVKMPKMDGYEACQLLRAQDSTKDIPVVFLSARGQDSEIQRGLELGAEEYILKPFAPDELYRRVGSILARRKRQQKR
jgi:DNA-binding response OmpR family regulator